MKAKRLTILAISVIMFLGISATLIAQNMVTNPGFENWTAGEPDDWTYETGVTITQETTIVHSGTSSAKVLLTTQTQGDTDTQNTEFAVTAGQPYNCSVWVYDNDPAGRATIVLYWNGASTTYSNVYSSDQDSWQELTYSGSVPTGATGLQVGFRFYDVTPWPGSATMYVDDYSFEISTSSEIVDAYAISTDALEVFFNQDMTSVNPADYTLTGTATITFSNATIDGADPKLVHLTGASEDMIGDITLDNIYDAENDTDFDFYAGITPIALTNTLNPDGHIVNGEFATFQGIVSANDDYNNVWVSDAYGPYNGVLIYDYDFDAWVAVGDEILFVAKRDEYNNLTELKDPILISTISTGNLPYSPADISGSDIGNTIAANTNPAEQWEGQLVVINNVLVAASPVNKDDLYIGSDDSWVTTFVIGDEVDYQYENIGPVLDDAIASGEPIDIKGVVDWNTYENYYRINPRSVEDLLDVDDYPHPANSFVLYQNYPNPFSASTSISFFNTKPSKNTKIEIYNIKGQLVKQFPITNRQSSIIWDGTEKNGKSLSDGIYFYKLTGGKKSLTKKMILIK